MNTTIVSPEEYLSTSYKPDVNYIDGHLEERKAQIYENLRDLQFEFRLGKLSDTDYQKTKLDLQRELAKVLAEIDAVEPAAPAKPAKAPAAKVRPDGKTCPHCNAKFDQPMRFCGECGKAMA